MNINELLLLVSILAIVGAGGLGAILVLNSDPKERMLGKHLVATAVILSIVGINSNFLEKHLVLNQEKTNDVLSLLGLFIILIPFIFPSILSVFIFAVTLPYRVTFFIEQKEVLERAFIFVGILLGSIAVIFF